MKILLLSDTHTKHRSVTLPEEKIDLVIHCGDAADSFDIEKNTDEMLDFLQWYDSLPIKTKIFVPGNHDLSVYRNKIKPDNWKGINFLIDSYIDVTYDVGGVATDTLRIFGSPWTPIFSKREWGYTMSHEKLSNFWNKTYVDCDILVTHGPPKGILDGVKVNPHVIELTGDKALFNKVTEAKPKLHIFGHIHDQGNIFKNFGVRKIENTKFINCSLKIDSSDKMNKPIVLDSLAHFSEYSTTI
jgi:Icc-related predicted phosphoesterase